MAGVRGGVCHFKVLNAEFGRKCEGQLEVCVEDPGECTFVEFVVHYDRWPVDRVWLVGILVGGGDCLEIVGENCDEDEDQGYYDTISEPAGIEVWGNACNAVTGMTYCVMSATACATAQIYADEGCTEPHERGTVFWMTCACNKNLGGGGPGGFTAVTAMAPSR